MFNLDEEEQRIEDEAELAVPVSGEDKKRIDAILERARKTRAISLRITEFDLAKLKERAELEGLPYQTLINTILRKYISNQLIDKRELYKTVSLAREPVLDYKTRNEE